MSGKNKSRKNRSKKILVVLALLIVIISVIYISILYFSTQSNVNIEKKYGLSDASDCKTVIKISDKAIRDSNYKDANTLLSSKKSICQSDKSKISQLSYYIRLSAVESILKDKSSSKNHAEVVLKLDKQMPTFEKATTPNYDSYIIDAQQLKEGSYQGDAIFF